MLSRCKGPPRPPQARTRSGVPRPPLQRGPRGGGTRKNFGGASSQKAAGTAGVNSSPRLGFKQTLPKQLSHFFIFIFFSFPLFFSFSSDDAVLNRSSLSYLLEGSAGGRCRFVGGLDNLQSIWRDFLAGQNAGLAPYKCREVAAVHV